MSLRTIKITPVGHPHSLALRVRTVVIKTKYPAIKIVTVQHEGGVYFGQGRSLRDAIADFQSRWSFFNAVIHAQSLSESLCSNRSEIASARTALTRIQSGL